MIVIPIIVRFCHPSPTVSLNPLNILKRTTCMTSTHFQLAIVVEGDARHVLQGTGQDLEYSLKPYPKRL